MSQVENPRLLWHDPKEWMIRVLAHLERETELVQDGTMLECGTVGAILAEVEERIQGVEGVCIVPPSLALILAQDECLEANEEWLDLFERISISKHAYIVLHDEGPPRHYTLVDIHASDEGRQICYKDSLSGFSESARATATRIIRRIRIEAECPEPSNEMHQTDDWSCGLWCARWVERSLRGLRGEAARPPSDFRAATRRANDFIERLKGARPKSKAKAKAEAKAQVEGKTTFTTIKNMIKTMRAKADTENYDERIDRIDALAREVELLEKKTKGARKVRFKDQE